MNRFLFITHLTPKVKRSSFREALNGIYFSALNDQSYHLWKVLIVGEEDRTEGNFHWFKMEENDGSHERRMAPISKLLARPEVQELFAEADYVIKLDDDDIISPILLDALKDFNGDLYYDRFHTFIDSSSGIITQQERPWIASTCVHKKEHALAKWEGEGASSVGILLYSDHSKAWHAYYSQKKKTSASINEPVYLRVLSPSSITSGALKGPVNSVKEIDMRNYYTYLRGFGEWKRAATEIFNDRLPSIRKAWQDFAGFDWKPLPRKKTFSKFIDRITGKR